MGQMSQFTSKLSACRLSRIAAFALILCAASAGALHAQSRSTESEPPAPAALPTAPAPSSGAPLIAPSQALGVHPLTFAQSPYRQFAAPELGDAQDGLRIWDRSIAEPFQPGRDLGNFTFSAGSGARPNGLSVFANGWQPIPSLDSTAGNHFAPRGELSAPLFPPESGTANILLTPPASGALPSLDQVMRHGYAVPFDAPAGTPRFAYPGALTPGSWPAEALRPANSMLFTSSDLGNGVFLSAGTGFGRSSNAGAPAATLGSSPGAVKHTGTSVAIKLSF